MDPGSHAAPVPKPGGSSKKFLAIGVVAAVVVALVAVFALGGGGSNGPSRPLVAMDDFQQALEEGGFDCSGWEDRSGGIVIGVSQPAGSYSCDTADTLLEIYTFHSEAGADQSTEEIRQIGCSVGLVSIVRGDTWRIDVVDGMDTDTLARATGGKVVALDC